MQVQARRLLAGRLQAATSWRIQDTIPELENGQVPGFDSNPGLLLQERGPRTLSKTPEADTSSDSERDSPPTPELQADSDSGTPTPGATRGPDFTKTTRATPRDSTRLHETPARDSKKVKRRFHEDSKRASQGPGRNSRGLNSLPSPRPPIMAFTE